MFHCLDRVTAQKGPIPERPIPERPTSKGYQKGQILWPVVSLNIGAGRCQRGCEVLRGMVSGRYGCACFIDRLNQVV